MRASLVALVVLVATVLSGCPGPSCPLQPHTDPERALAMHRSMRRTVVGIRAEARVDQRQERSRIRGDVLMMMERPDRVRFDAMTQFGPAAVLTSDGARFALMDMREHRFLEGGTCPANIARLLGIPMDGADLARFLVGDTPRIAATRQSMSCTGEGTYVVVLEAEDGRRQEIELVTREADREAPPEGQHLRLVRSEVFGPDGRFEWRATFEDHQVVPDPTDAEGRGVALPFVIHFVDARGADTLVRFRSIDLNVEIPEDAFTQSAPPGMAVEEVRCPGE